MCSWEQIPVSSCCPLLLLMLHFVCCTVLVAAGLSSYPLQQRQHRILSPQCRRAGSSSTESSGVFWLAPLCFAVSSHCLQILGWKTFCMHKMHIGSHTCLSKDSKSSSWLHGSACYLMENNFKKESLAQESSNKCGQMAFLSQWTDL